MSAVCENRVGDCCAVGLRTAHIARPYDPWLHRNRPKLVNSYLGKYSWPETSYIDDTVVVNVWCFPVNCTCQDSCSPAWVGFCVATDRERLDAFLRRCKRLPYCDDNLPSIANLFDNADDQLFKSILANSEHCICHSAPDSVTVVLRPRKRNKELIPKPAHQ